VLQLEDLPSARLANHGFAGFIDHIFTYLLGRRAKHIFAVSENVAAAFTRLSPVSQRKIHILPPALDPLFISKAERRIEPFSSSSFSILYAGSYQAEKGVDDLIEAFLRLPRGIYTLYLVGSAPIEISSKFKYCNEIVFTGVVSIDELFDYYVSADVVVNPHRSILNPDHVFPFKLIETFACGALPLTTPVPGVENLGLPEVCIFSGVDELTRLLSSAQSIWIDNRSLIRNLAFRARVNFSFPTIACLIKKNLV
jgi:glycosyltransferase involved in cell wall biosynthesis